MRLVKRIIFSFALACTVYGVGVLLLYLGGVGPCGPAFDSRLAEVGGYLSVYQLCLLGFLNPAYEAKLATVPAPIVALAVPLFNWMVIAFALLSVLPWVRRRIGDLRLHCRGN
jgi:hypothetical protein